MEGVPAPSVATSVSYVDGVTGGNVFVMTVKGARRLAAAMMGEALPDDDGGELSELELSAMGEAMNQMMSSAATATGSVLGKAVEIAPPEIRRFADAAEAVAAYDATAHAITAQLSVLGEPCRLVQLIPNAFIVRMNRALSELTTDYEARAGSPLSHSVRSVPLRVWAELGRVRMPLRGLVGLPAGAVVELDREVDDPIDLYVDDLLFATGRLLVTDEQEWAVRIETVHGVRGDAQAPVQLVSSSSSIPTPSTTTEGD
jgi:flagellar motor switch protein FliN/FliY